MTSLPQSGFGLLLLMCRCGALVMLLPGLGEEEPPAILRVLIAGGLALLLFTPIAPDLPPVPASPALLLVRVAHELLMGGVLGWLTRLMALALPVAGQILSLMTGHSSVLQPDPVLGQQAAVLGRLLDLLAPVLILASGLYALPLSALADSYRLFPPDGGLVSGDIARAAVQAVAASFALTLRLAAPFLMLSLLWSLSLALLTRLVPHIQLHFAALPGQILGGLAGLALLIGTLCAAWLQALPPAAP